jgi:beta-glucosidase
MLPTDHPVTLPSRFVTGYIDSSIEPLYSFGEGMTYTEFEYGEIVLDKSELHEGETLTASIKVKNVGDRDGCETVQLYIRDLYASVSRPVKELKRFKKVEVKAGETVNVEFTLTCDDFRFHNIQMEYVWEPGEIRIFIGKNSLCKEYKTVMLAE